MGPRRWLTSSSILVLGGLVAGLLPAGHTAAQQEAVVIITTTVDLRQDHDVLGVVTHYQELGFGLKGDPLERAIVAGCEKFLEKVRKAGGTAVVGVRLEFANRTERDEGRLLIYGTAVRLK